MFVVDTSAGVVHRAATARPECGLHALDAADRQEKATEFEATMVMKTRHYRACPHCYG